MTPLKLKRKTQLLESTLDRTQQQTLPKISLKDIIPSFTSSREVPPKIDFDPFKAKIAVSTTQTSTIEFEQEIFRNICEDNLKSQHPQQYGSKNKAYNDYPDHMKIVRASPWRIPEAASLGQPTYGHGCLSKSAIYYFAVQNRVLFYDLGNAVRFNRKIDQCLLLDLSFQQTIFQIKEIDWSTPFFKQAKNKNIIIISSPWQIQFSVLEIEESRHKQISKTSRWLKITMLNHYFSTNCRRALFLTEGNQQLFYLDQKGSISRLGIENNTFWDRIFDGRKEKLCMHITKQIFSKNYFFTNKKTSFFDKVKHFRKVIVSSLTNIFNSKATINGLVYDKTRKLLFSLIDSQSNNQSVQYSYSKLISCWKVISGKLSLICQISEVQLLTSNTNQQIFTHSISKNNKIVKICQIPESCYPNCSVLAILQNGTRLYLKIQDETFQISSYEFPPSFQVRGKYKKRECVQYAKPVELIHFHSEVSTKLLTIRQDDHNHTFVIFKENQLKEVQMVSHVLWNQNIYDGDCGSLPIQSFLFKSSLGYTNSKKSNLLKILSSQPNKMVASTPKNTIYMHQILRDVFEEIQMFVHVTDMSIEHFHVLRPLDMMFMIIKAQIFQPKIIQNIVDLDKKQIQFLLMQLLCDNEGAYIYDSTLTDCMNNYRNKCLQVGQYKSFQIHREQFFKEIAYNKSKKIRVKENQPEIIQYQFSQNQYQKVCDLIIRLCQQSSSSRQKQIKHEQRCYNEIKKITDCSLIYLSRILRFVWMLDLAQIPAKASVLIQMVQPLLKILDTIFDKQYISRYKILIENDYKNPTIYKNRANSLFWFDSNKQERNKEDQFKQSLELIEKIKYFINKIIQLILMTTQTTLKIKKKFNASLGLEPQFFQQYIFNYLIINYQQPIKILDSYRKAFPIFIGKNLQKSLKIYNQTINLNTKSIYQTAKHHKNLPDYLLSYLRSEKGIKPSQVMQISKNKSQTVKLNSPSGSKQIIQQLNKRLTQQYLSIMQRNKLIYIANKELEIYNQQKGKSEDTFYRTMKRQIKQIYQIITIQEIILNQYQNRKGLQDITLIDHLKNEILKKQGLRDIISVMETPKLKILYYYYFQNSQTLQHKKQLQDMYNQLLQEQYDLALNKSDKSKSKYIKFLSFGSNTNSNKWEHLKDQLKFIVNKSKQFLLLASFVDILKVCLESTRISRQARDRSTQLQSISSLKNFMTYDFKNNLNVWIRSSDYPILSLILVDSGISQDSLSIQYMELFKQHSLSKKIISSQIPHILHIWINLYCLLVQYKNGTQILDFADYSKKIVTILQKNTIQIISRKYLQEIKQLTEILVYTKIGHQKIGTEYFLEEIKDN